MIALNHALNTVYLLHYSPGGGCVRAVQDLSHQHWFEKSPGNGSSCGVDHVQVHVHAERSYTNNNEEDLIFFRKSKISKFRNSDEWGCWESTKVAENQRPFSLLLTGISWNFEPLDHLLPLRVIGAGGAWLRCCREFGDSKQSHDTITAQRSRDGDECCLGRDGGPLSSGHLRGEKSQNQFNDTGTKIFAFPFDWQGVKWRWHEQIDKDINISQVKQCKVLSNTHLTEFIVGHQVEVIDGE